MSVALLDQTRKISRLLHDNSSRVVIFDDICGCVGEILGASCMLASAKGKVLGLYKHEGAPDLSPLLGDEVGDLVDSQLNNRFLAVLSTKENVNLQTLGFERAVSRGSAAILLPVYFAGQRMGTTFIFRSKEEFDVDDIILSEYANTVIELIIMRALYDEDDAEERQQAALAAALASLSQTEQSALDCIMDALMSENGIKNGIKTGAETGNRAVRQKSSERANMSKYGGSYSGDAPHRGSGSQARRSLDKEELTLEGNLITSRIAQDYGITRSIIVNALRKLEGAEILETKSMGVRGTHIRILNTALILKYRNREVRS
jgi:transcriptional pleiotropic repressor